MHSVIKTSVTKDGDKIKKHLKNLSSEDRRLRFTSVVSDDVIDRYVDGLDKQDSEIYVIYNDELEVIAFLHYGIDEAAKSADVGLSVDPRYRKQGLGYKLFEQAVLLARINGHTNLGMYCLYENSAMRKMAQKAGMKTVAYGSEVQSTMVIPERSIDEIWKDYIEFSSKSQLSLIDYSLKQAFNTVQSHSLQFFSRLVENKDVQS